MPKPKYSEAITGFRKVNQYADQKLEQKVELSDFMNGRLDRDGGKCVKRGGFPKLSENPAPTDSILDLTEFVDSNGIDWIIGLNNQKLIKSRNGTGAWQEITEIQGTRIKYAVYENSLFVASSKELLEIVDAEDVYDLQVAAPDINDFDIYRPAASSEGNLTDDSLYYWIFVYRLKNNSFSKPSLIKTTYAKDLIPAVTPNRYNTTTSSAKKLLFKNNTGAKLIEDDRIESLLLYRTKANEPLVFYLHSELENKDSDSIMDEFLENKADIDLDPADTIKFSAELTGAEYPLVHQNRLFLANVTYRPIYPYNAPMNNTNKLAAPTDWLTPNNLVVSGVTGGSLTAESTYKYKIYYEDDTGLKSLEYDLEITLAAGETRVNFLNAIWQDDEDLFNAKFKIYRTKANGTVYYNVTEFIEREVLNEPDPPEDPEKIQLYDTAADTSLTEELETLIISEGSIIVYSETEKPNEIRAISVEPIVPDELDPITGITELPEGILIHKLNSVWRLITQSGLPQNWYLSNVSKQLGCDFPDSITQGSLGVYFMKNNQVYRYPDKLFEPVSLSRKDDIDLIYAVYESAYIASMNYYIMACGSGLFVYDEKLDTWYIWGEKPSERGYGYNYSTLYGRRL